MANVPIAQVAEELGVGIRHALRLVQKRAQVLNLQPLRGKRNAVSLTRDDADRLIADYQPRRGVLPAGDVNGMDPTGFGVFYVIQLHPQDLPNRIKIGYTDNLTIRMSDHRTTAPTLKLLGAWPCKRIWDRAVMDSITREGCRPHGGEVYDGEPQGFIDRAEAFFSLMPFLEARNDVDSDVSTDSHLAQPSSPPNARSASLHQHR